MAKSRPAPVGVSPAVPILSAARAGVDESLTGKDRRRAEMVATGPVKPKRVRALQEQLDAVVADAAEVGLRLEVDHEALVAVAAGEAAALTAPSVTAPSVTAPSVTAPAAPPAGSPPASAPPAAAPPAAAPPPARTRRTPAAQGTIRAAADPVRRRASPTRGTATRTPARRPGGSGPA